MAYVREYPSGLEGGPFAKSRSQFEDFTHIDLGCIVHQSHFCPSGISWSIGDTSNDTVRNVLLHKTIIEKAHWRST